MWRDYFKKTFQEKSNQIQKTDDEIKKILQDISNDISFYESTHRILKALSSLNERLQDDKKVTVVREITKIHEEVISGDAVGVLEHFNTHTDTVRGEFVVIISNK